MNIFYKQYYFIFKFEFEYSETLNEILNKKNRKLVFDESKDKFYKLNIDIICIFIVLFIRHKLLL